MRGQYEYFKVDIPLYYFRTANTYVASEKYGIMLHVFGSCFLNSYLLSLNQNFIDFRYNIKSKTQLVGPLVDSFQSHTSRSLLNCLPWFVLPFGFQSCLVFSVIYFGHSVYMLQPVSSVFLYFCPKQVLFSSFATKICGLHFNAYSQLEIKFCLLYEISSLLVLLHWNFSKNLFGLLDYILTKKHFVFALEWHTYLCVCVCVCVCVCYIAAQSTRGTVLSSLPKTLTH